MVHAATRYFPMAVALTCLLLFAPKSVCASNTIVIGPPSISQTWTMGPAIQVAVTVTNNDVVTFRAAVREGNTACTQPQDASWLTLSANQLEVPPLSNGTFTAILDPTALASGAYSATICIGQTPLPVSFTVAPANPQSEEIFGNGFEPLGFAIPLASPEGPDTVYTAQVTVGNQTFAVAVQTASGTLAVAGSSCTSGCSGLSPLYNPSASASDTGFTASATYSNGSGWSGKVFADAVGLGNGSPSIPLDFAEITHASDFFFNNDYQGILGLGPQGAAAAHTLAFLPALTGAGVNNIFALELCHNIGANAGTLWLGGDGVAVTAQRTPLVPISGSNPFYAINVDALSLGTTVIATGASNFQQPVLDVGTSLFYVPTPVYTAFTGSLQASAEFKSVFGNNTFSSLGCVTDASVTDDQVESMLPTITLSLPNVATGQPDVSITASALDTYLYNAGSGQYCLAIQDGGSQNGSTFGVAFLQAFHTVVDLAGGRVGFAAPASCTSPTRRGTGAPN